MMQQSCEQCGILLPSEGQQQSSPVPTDKVLCPDCASHPITPIDRGECLNCRQQLEIVRFHSVQDVFMYLKRENLFKPEFEEIESNSLTATLTAEKTICKNCLIQIIMKGGINSLLSALNINTAQNCEEPKIEIETKGEKPNENTVNNKEGIDTQKTMTDIPMNQYNNTLMNSNSNINLNTSANGINTMNQNYYNQMQYQPAMQNGSGYPQFQMNNNMSFYNNSLLSFYNYYQNQEAMNSQTQNMNINSFPSQFNDNKTKKEIGTSQNMNMMMNQFNPQFNMMKQNFPSNLNTMNMMNNSPSMLFEGQKDNINMDDLQKQINTMKECNKIQKTYLNQLYELIGKFDEQVKQIQKNYYAYVPPTGYQQNLNPFMALRTPVQDMNGTQLNGQIK